MASPTTSDEVDGAARFLFASYAPERATEHVRIADLVVPPNAEGSLSLHAPWDGEAGGLRFEAPNPVAAGRHPVVIALGPDWYRPEERGRVVLGGAVLWRPDAVAHAEVGADVISSGHGFSVSCIGWNMGFGAPRRLLRLAVPALRAKGLPVQRRQGRVATFAGIEEQAAGHEEPGAFADGWWQVGNGDANAFGFITNHETVQLTDLRDRQDRPVAAVFTVTQ
ncbi:hypothetical protein [Kitasatospora sp. NPDC088134]|uniref:hypothetical protein n=1 Tax=Kitasatospora sp. NPDC088134 TaxID=3364071 RepID=UPI0038223D84